MSASFFERYGTWAIVTGASSGIGEETARQLAARGLSLVLCARRKDRLEALAAKLVAAHGIEVRVLELDVGRLDFAEPLLAEVAGLDVGLVVSNAGFGEKGPFLASNLARDLQMLDVNCRAFLIIAHTFAPRLVARGRGGMIFTSSTAAFQGLPFTAHYAATGRFVHQVSSDFTTEDVEEICQETFFTVIKSLGTCRCGVGFSANTQHRQRMAHRCEALQQTAAHPLGGRIGCQQFGVRRLQRLQFAKQAVVLSVRQFRRVQHVIAVGVVVQQLVQFSSALLGFDVCHGPHFDAALVQSSRSLFS